MAVDSSCPWLVGLIQEKLNAWLIMIVFSNHRIIFCTNIVSYGRIRIHNISLCQTCRFQNLSEILSERDTISSVMKIALDEATDPWGVRVERVEVKDVRLPVQLQRAMAAEAEAAREARAKVNNINIIMTVVAETSVALTANTARQGQSISGILCMRRTTIRNQINRGGKPARTAAECQV